MGGGSPESMLQSLRRGLELRRERRSSPARCSICAVIARTASGTSSSRRRTGGDRPRSAASRASGSQGSSRSIRAASASADDETGRSTSGAPGACRRRAAGRRPRASPGARDPARPSRLRSGPGTCRRRGRGRPAPEREAPKREPPRRERSRLRRRHQREVLFQQIERIGERLPGRGAQDRALRRPGYTPAPAR